MRNRIRLTALATGLTLLLAGCAGAGTPSGSPTTITPAVTATKTAPPEPVVPQIWPLTGVEGDVVERPAIAVKIENTAAARPQTGLSAADVVWEEIVEFGVSRLVVVYHSQLPEEIGPIRSVRPMDARVASPLKGLIAFSGGQAGILGLMRTTPLQLLSHDAGTPGFYRISARRAPHNVYGSLETFLGQADEAHRASPGEQFAFATRPGQSAAELAGTPAGTIGLRLAPGVVPNWTWDAGAGKWLRSEGTAPSNDTLGPRVAATNVVVVVVESFDSGFDAQGGAPVPDLRLEGSGTAVVATGGKTLQVTWNKAGRDEPLTLTGPDGSIARLAPGNTWVELVPAGSGSYEIS